MNVEYIPNKISYLALAQSFENASGENSIIGC